MTKLSMFSVLIMLCFASSLFAEVQTKTVPYKQGDIAFEGYMAWDDEVKGKRPGILVVHEWWGLNDYAKKRCDMLAKQGYVAFAVDMYGKGKVTKHPEQAGKWMKMIAANVEQWQTRALKGIELLKESEHVDQSKIAAIGYCFGGATVCQFAYSGADVKAVVSFHGSLPVPTKEQAKKVKASMLLCHGVADGFVPEERIIQFVDALENGKVDYQFVAYAGAKHGFTNKAADDAGLDGLAYNEKADKRSWSAMKKLFREVFAD